MKKSFWIILIILALLASVVVPLFTKDDNSDYVQFTFKENLATSWNSIIPIAVEIKTDELEKLEIYYNDSLVQTFSNPKDSVGFELNAGFFGLGNRSISLKAYQNGEVAFQDERMVMVLSDIKPEILYPQIVKTYPHNREHFTQGLEFDGGQLYESTGDPSHEGKTNLGRINLADGSFSQKIGLDANYFGEGMTILGNEIYQLTYTQGKAFIYDKTTLQLKKEFTYAGEGWGLCNDGTYLYMTDGSERITKRDAKTFEVLETIEVYDNSGPIKKLNELEFVDGKIYANVWQTNAILVIQPENGKVLAVINASELEKTGNLGGDVLNGIAYNRQSKTFFLTGKYWSKIFEVKIGE